MRISIGAFAAFTIVSFVLKDASAFSLLIRSHVHPALRDHPSRIRLSTLNDSGEDFDANIDVGEEANAGMNQQSSFETLGLSKEILSAVRAQPGWKQPTPIQQLAIPEILTSDRSSLWCEAPTGSGKTAAYALPLLQNLSTRKGVGIASVVLCPTRELAVQIGNVFSKLCYNVGGKKKWNVVVIHGGVPLDPQIVDLSNANRLGNTIDVLIATPGRLVDILTYYDECGNGDASDSALERRLLDALDAQGKSGDSTLSLSQIEDLELDRIDDDGRNSMKELLRGVDTLVIDEADKLLSRTFESEVDGCLDLFLENEKSIKTWLFSATFPKQIEPRVNFVLKRLGGEAAEKPLRISCSNSDRVVGEDVSASLQRRLKRAGDAYQVQQQIGPASTIQLRSVRLDQTQRTLALRKLLEDHPEWDRVLVFVGTRYAAEHVAMKLRRAGIESAELHGKLDQDARTRRLNAFVKGRTRVLLATDVASRGLDVVGLPAVVNYDLPRSTADFVHRVGRTGRAGRPGVAVTFVTSSSEGHLELIESRHLAHPIEREVLEGFEPNEATWQIKSAASRISAPGAQHSTLGLDHDRMNGGIKGHRKSKKDRAREEAARTGARKTQD
jgi:ATP-dependent RNA helicase RhlE